jgi:hypothetical protein
MTTLEAGVGDLHINGRSCHVLELLRAGAACVTESNVVVL